MNKILLATTALVATAGFAAAEVSLSGSAEMGLADFGGVNGVEFHSDLDVRFTLSGETDGGLTFGATIDLDEVSGGISNKAGSDAVFISGGFGTLTMGDTDGALDWAMQEIAIGSAIADDHSTYASYNANSGLDGSLDGQVLRYDNTFGDFGVAISAELNDGNNAGIAATASDSFGIGVKYNVALGGLDLGLGLGYQDGTYTTRNAAGVVTSTADADIVGLSVDTTFANGLRAILNYSDRNVVADTARSGKTTGLGLGYTSGALTVSANYTDFSADSGVAADDGKGFGAAVNYDLGGAAVQFGYGDEDGGTSTWSLGLAMSF